MPGLALGELDGDAGLGHLVADAGDDVLLPRRLQELVVLDRRRRAGVRSCHRLAPASANESRNR